jgi:hypothetical protein
MEQRLFVPLFWDIHPLVVDAQFHEGASVSGRASHFIQDAPRGIEETRQNSRFHAQRSPRHPGSLILRGYRSSGSITTLGMSLRTQSAIRPISVACHFLFTHNCQILVALV